MSPQLRGERYVLTTRIATGGMGEVWRAEDTVLDREVAVKVLKQEFADDPAFRTRFESEARHAASLHHPNVASVFDFGELPDQDGSGVTRPFLVMELVPGEPLSTLLRDREPMPVDRAVAVVAQAADAIAAAHALGIVHRDVKPGNLLVTPDGTVKITDFGIARAADGASITQTGQIIGTPHYISPEQAEGRPATESSDVYALGVVLYECLAGRRPFERDTPIQIALAHVRDEVPPLGEDVPAWLRAVVAQALAKDPALRFGSAVGLAAALRAGVAVPDPDATQLLTPVGAAVPPGQDEAGSRRTAPPWWPWGAAAAAVLALVLTTASFAGGERSQTAASAATTPEASPSVSQVADERVRVREAAYLGLQYKDVKDELQGLGLKVRQEKVPASSPQQAKDTVARVRPRGLVRAGTTVTVAVFEEYVPPPSDDDEDDEDDDEDDRGKPDKSEKAKKSKGKAKGNKD